MARELLPLSIATDEILLRSVREKDVSKIDNKIKLGAIKPGRNERDAVSLIRRLIGTRESAEAAIAHVHGVAFWGFGSAVASTLYAHCESLSDDRVTFHGHANLKLGYTIPPGPPNTPPEMTEAYALARSRLLELIDQFEVSPYSEAQTPLEEIDLSREGGD
jgi:hypothetical protein